jgi:hypothetical protein
MSRRRKTTVNQCSRACDLVGISSPYHRSTLKRPKIPNPDSREFDDLPMEVRMQTRLARSWSALRYDLSSQRALDNAAQMRTEHDRILAEIDALAARLDAVIPPEAAASAQKVA